VTFLEMNMKPEFFRLLLETNRAGVVPLEAAAKQALLKETMEQLSIDGMEIVLGTFALLFTWSVIKKGPITDEQLFAAMAMYAGLFEELGWNPFTKEGFGTKEN
jgi:hypothetical protein